MTWFFGSRKTLYATLLVIFLLAIGIRFYDLTDLPLDIHATRQLFSALKARGMYYATNPAGVPDWQKEIAIRQWKSIQEIEPPVMETIVANTYRVFGEHLWIARIYSSLFWVLGGIFLFLLAREITNGINGAVVALMFYLFLPYGTIMSRTFQPDPLMVALIVAGAWATFRWRNAGTWKWAIAAGLLNGLAIFVKNVAVFPLAFAAVALVLERGIQASAKDKQTWAVAGLSALPTAIYMVYGLFVADFLGQQFAFRFFPQLWGTLGFYLRWKEMIDSVTGFGVFALAIVGVFTAQRRGFALLLGLWAGYFAYGMTFAYHITTHDYYHLMLIPLVALSLAPAAETLLETVTRSRGGLVPARILLGLAVVLVAFIQIWNVRVALIREDWQPEAVFWSDLGKTIGYDGPVLTMAPDYGYRLAYWGWQEVDSWLTAGDLAVRELDGRQINLLDKFKDQAAGKRFFVVTQISKLDDQPEIKNYVNETYPVFARTDEYIIYDLQGKK
jgi:4-amino-4-deoxy-L-arabinose transferase-like glycosyltransferase